MPADILSESDTVSGHCVRTGCPDRVSGPARPQKKCPPGAVAPYLSVTERSRPTRPQRVPKNEVS